MAAVDTTSDWRPVGRPAHDGAEQTTGSPRLSSGDLAMTALLRGRRTRDPVVVSIGGATVLAVVLVTLAVNAPLEGNVDHAVGHLSLAVPIFLLLAAVLFTWPPLASGRPAHWIRMFLIMSLGLFGGGLLLEAVGAFGYPDTAIQISSLEWAHAVGVATWSSGFILTLAAGILSVAVVVAARRGAAQTRIMTVAVVLAVVSVVAFVGGSLIFGY